MEELRAEYIEINKDYETFYHSLRSFSKALDNARIAANDPSATIHTVEQIQTYLDTHVKHAVDKRILTKWLDLHQRLYELRVKFDDYFCTNFQVDNGDDTVKLLISTLTRWRKILEPRYDFSELRAKYPHPEVIHLSCMEAQYHFGGVVSVIPIVLDIAQEAKKQLASLHRKFNTIQEMNSLKTSAKPSPKNPVTPKTSQPATPTRIRTAPIERGPPATYRTELESRYQKFISSSDIKAQLKMINGRVAGPNTPLSPQKKALLVPFKPARVWRGASKGAINHVAHRYCGCMDHEETMCSDHVYHAAKIV